MAKLIDFNSTGGISGDGRTQRQGQMLQLGTPKYLASPIALRFVVWTPINTGVKGWHRSLSMVLLVSGHIHPSVIRPSVRK